MVGLGSRSQARPESAGHVASSRGRQCPPHTEGPGRRRGRGGGRERVPVTGCQSLRGSCGQAWGRHLPWGGKAGGHRRGAQSWRGGERGEGCDKAPRPQGKRTWRGPAHPTLRTHTPSGQPSAGEILPQHFLTSCPPGGRTLWPGQSPCTVSVTGLQSRSPRTSRPSLSPRSRCSRPPCRSPATAQCSRSPALYLRRDTGCALPSPATAAWRRERGPSPPDSPRKAWSPGPESPSGATGLSVKTVVQNC